MQDFCLTPNYESSFISWGQHVIFNEMIMMSGLF